MDTAELKRLVNFAVYRASHVSYPDSLEAYQRPYRTLPKSTQYFLIGVFGLCLFKEFFWENMKSAYLFLFYCTYTYLASRDIFPLSKLKYTRRGMYR